MFQTTSSEFFVPKLYRANVEYLPCKIKNKIENWYFYFIDLRVNIHTDTDTLFFYANLSKNENHTNIINFIKRSSKAQRCTSAQLLKGSWPNHVLNLILKGNGQSDLGPDKSLWRRLRQYFLLIFFSDISIGLHFMLLLWILATGKLSKLCLANPVIFCTQGNVLLPSSVIWFLNTVCFGNTFFVFKWGKIHMLNVNGHLGLLLNFNFTLLCLLGSPWLWNHSSFLPFDFVCYSVLLGKSVPDWEGQTGRCQMQM